MAKLSVIVQVRQQDGSPAPFAMVQFYRRGCIWFACFDSYYQTKMADLNGRVSASLDLGEWRFRGLYKGLEGNARCKLTAAGVGTVAQWGKLNVMVYIV